MSPHTARSRVAGSAPLRRPAGLLAVVGALAVTAQSALLSSTATAAPVTTTTVTTTTATTTAVTAAQTAATARPGTHDLIAVGNVEEGTSEFDGAVHVYFADGRRQLLTAADLGIDTGDSHHLGDLFGLGVASADLNGDGLTDLVIGIPGNDVCECGGKTVIAFQSAAGFTAGRITELPGAPAGVAEPATSPKFGQAVAIGTRASGNGHDLWVGAPQTSVHGKVWAGAVYRYSVDAAGTPVLRNTITEDSAVRSGHSVAGDRFGRILSAGPNGVVAGMPDKAVGTHEYAGAVLALRTDPVTDKLLGGQEWNQNSPGVPGSAERSDRFGSSIAGGGTIIGVPQEDLGTATKSRNVGLVQLFTRSRNKPGVLVPGRALSQASSGVPGSQVHNYLFGSAVATGVFRCAGVTMFAIGSAGDGAVSAAGEATLIPDPAATKSCPAVVLRQGHGLPGTAERNDGTGTVLGTATGDPADGAKRIDRLLIGAPFENANSSSQVFGRAIVYRGSAATSNWLTPIPGDRFENQFPSSFANATS